MIYLSVKITEMIYNLSGNVVNDAKMLMWCQTTHLYKLTVHFYHCINRGNILTRSQLGRYYFRKKSEKENILSVVGQSLSTNSHIFCEA